MTLRIHNLGQGARRLILATLLVLTILAGGVAIPVAHTLLGDHAIARAIVRNPRISGESRATPGDEGLAMLNPCMQHRCW